MSETFTNIDGQMKVLSIANRLLDLINTNGITEDELNEIKLELDTKWYRQMLLENL